MCTANTTVQVFVVERFEFSKRWKWRIGDMVSSKTYATQGLAQVAGAKFRESYKVQPFEFVKQEKRYDRTL